MLHRANLGSGSTQALFSLPNLEAQKMTWDFFIIGADAAGLSAAVQIKRLKPQTSIRVVNKGKFISYGACGMTYVISGEISSLENLIHFTPEGFLKSRGIAIEIHREAINIFPPEHAVEVKNLETGEVSKQEYKKLLIATGAAAKRLTFLDYSEEGIFNVHNLEDLAKILEYLEKRKPGRAAVIGAGNIGLELTEALHKRGVEVLLFEVLSEPAMLWPPLVRRAVLKKIQERGVLLFTNTSLRRVSKKDQSFVIETDEKNFETEVVFSVVGTSPATDFCLGKLDLEKNGAIRIDRHGQTSDVDIYAAGDCATAYHKILRRSVYLPLGSTANKMGRIAGMNMTGEDVLFPGIVGTQIMKFFELSLAKTGLSLEEAQKEGLKAQAYSAARTDKANYYPGASLAEVEIISEEGSGKIIGATAVCEGNAAQFIDPAAVAVFTGMTVRDLAWFDSAYAPPYAPVWNALISAALKAIV
jgi:NADPH-dependent 2,4-dienoyl-CoA reductase/sulfur reductase-like enzyme